MGVAEGQIAEIRRPARGGIPFAPVRERELDDSLRRLALQLPGADQGLLLSPEFPGPNGVVDLLAATRVTAPLEFRVQDGGPFLSQDADAAIVAATHESVTRTARFISVKLAMSERQVIRRLRRLTDLGFVDRVGGGYRRRHGLRPIGRTYALEAKVRDWRRGLEQSLRYANWCDASAVVLLLRPTRLDDVVERYQALGVGLALGDSWLVRPRIGRPNPGSRLLVSELIAAEVARSYSPSAEAYSSRASD